MTKTAAPRSFQKIKTTLDDGPSVSMDISRERSSTKDLRKTQERFDAISDDAREKSRQPAGPTLRHVGAACTASGLPAEKRTCN